MSCRSSLWTREKTYNRLGSFCFGAFLSIYQELTVLYDEISYSVHSICKFNFWPSCQAKACVILFIGGHIYNVKVSVFVLVVSPIEWRWFLAWAFDCVIFLFPPLLYHFYSMSMLSTHCLPFTVVESAQSGLWVCFFYFLLASERIVALYFLSLKSLGISFLIFFQRTSLC